MKKRALSLALVLSLCVSLLAVPASAAGGEYTDTRGHWAESSIRRWSEYEIVKGDNGQFRPDDSLTRGQMAKILANTLGLTDEGTGNPFTDVPAEAWYTPYILRCYVAGVMVGDGQRANPDAFITRQEAMTALCRALGIQPVQNADLSAYHDGGTVASWAAPYVAAMTRAGIVNGVGGNLLAPADEMSRASIMTVLDRSIVQYINKPGTYALVDKEGLVLVSSGDVTLTGKTAANILVTPAADGKELTFDKANVTGTITVQADNAKLLNKNSSKLPNLVVTGVGSKVEESKPAAKPSGGGGGGGGGSSTPSYTNLTVAEAKTVDGSGSDAIKTYQDVTITDAVADGTVTLSNMTILGNLYINGGGANTVNLTNVVIKGKIIINKKGGERPRLLLTNTPISSLEVNQPATIEAADAASAVAAVQAKANVYVVGADTKITTVTVPAGVESAVTVDVTAGTVAKVEAKSETSVTGSASNAVAEVVAEAPVTVAADTVAKVEVPASAPADVAVAVTGSGTVDVAVNSANGAAVTAESKKSVSVSTDLETPPTVTVNGEAVEHIHKWGEWEPVDNDSHKRVCKLDESHVETAFHTFAGQWTYVDAEHHKDVCTTCQWEEVNAHISVTIPAVAATCTEVGKTEGSTCSLCNAVLKAQETVPALGHDFTGAYQSDADGHWHKCTRCDVTDEKAAHTYPAGTSCDAAATCTVCGYEKAAGTHTWGAWSKKDDTDHQRTCSLCGKVETTAHNWDEGKVTTDPTETTPGVKTFTCSDCKATKIESLPVAPAEKVWFSYHNSAGVLNMAWTDSNLASGEYYGVNGQYIGIQPQYWLYGDADLLNKTASETMNFKITKGTYSGGSYTAAEDIGTLTLPLTVEDAPGTITVTPQADGSYLATGGNQGYDGYFYRLKHPDGTTMGSASYSTLNGTLDQGAPYEGCTFEVSQFKIEWGKYLGQGQSKWYDRYASIENFIMTKPQVITITADNLPIAPSEPVNAGTLAELKEALDKGGTVNLTADITLAESDYLSASTGAPSVLNLNGHTITSAFNTFQVASGKELTIDGTTAGSGIYCTKPNFNFGVYNGAKLTITGGSYTTIASQNAREISLTNVTAEDTDSALFLHNTPKVTITGSNFTVPYDASDGTVDATIDGCAEVSVTNTAFSCHGLNVVDCANAKISGCTFSVPDNTPTGYGVSILVECSTATLENNTGASLDVRSMWQKPSNVTVKSGSYTNTSVTSQADSKDVASTLTIEGGTFATNIRLRDKANLYVSGVDFTSFDRLFSVYTDTDEVGTVKVSSGTFGFDPTEYLASGYTATKGGTEDTPTWMVSKTTTP